MSTSHFTRMHGCVHIEVLRLLEHSRGWFVQVWNVCFVKMLCSSRNIDCNNCTLMLVFSFSSKLENIIGPVWSPHNAAENLVHYSNTKICWIHTLALESQPQRREVDQLARFQYVRVNDPLLSLLATKVIVHCSCSSMGTTLLQ